MTCTSKWGRSQATSSTCLLLLLPRQAYDNCSHLTLSVGMVSLCYEKATCLGGGAFCARFPYTLSQWLERLWSMCDDLDICNTRLFRLQDWLCWGRGKRSDGSNSSTSPSNCHISPSNALLCIPLQSTSHSVLTNVTSVKPVTNCEGRSGRTERDRKVDRGGWSCSVVTPYSQHPDDLFPRTQCR